MRLARVRATAYPKLNLSLRVLGRRADGFHDLESLVVSLGQPHDVLEAFAVPAPGGVQVEVVARRGRRRRPGRPPQPRVHRRREADGPRRVGPVTACGSCCASTSPPGGGLGGGSADAAAALLAVRQLLDVDIDDAGVLAIAAEVGSDVPFCVRGGAAWMRGRGEIIEPVSLPTGWRSWWRSRRSGCRPPTCTGRGTSSAARGPTRVRARAPTRRARSCRSWSTTSSRRPRRSSPGCVEFRNALEAATGAPALLAGSGSAYVVPVRRRAAAAGAGRRGQPPPPRARRRHDERRPRRPPRQLTPHPSPFGVATRDRGRRRRVGRGLAALLTALPARLLQKLLVLLLPHALAALLDQ